MVLSLLSLTVMKLNRFDKGSGSIQFHMADFAHEEAVQTRDTLEEPVEAGKIKDYAWSTDKLENVQLFAEGQNCIAVQQELNVFLGNMEILSLCERSALAWIWAKSENTIPIPGFKTVKQVEENVGAIEYGLLNSAQMDEIERVFASMKERECPEV